MTSPLPQSDHRFCASCGAELTPGARFCHRCGTPVGAAIPAIGGGAAGRGSAATALPWAVAAIALLALIAWGAGQHFGQRSASTLDAPSNALPQAALGDPGAGGGPVNAPFAGGAAGGPDNGTPQRAPDISSMSPDERATRLFNRVMRYAEQGKKDSVQVFAPMAILSYQMLPSITTEQRYELGRLGEVTGAYDVAKAQADTILKANPDHLLALALAARMSPDPAQRTALERRLVAAAPKQLAAPLPEYTSHRVEVDSMVAQARHDVGAAGTTARR